MRNSVGNGLRLVRNELTRRIWKWLEQTQVEVIEVAGVARI